MKPQHAPPASRGDGGGFIVNDPTKNMHDITMTCELQDEIGTPVSERRAHLLKQPH